MAAAGDPGGDAGGELFTTRITHEDGRAVVWAAGELDMTVSPVLEAVLAGATVPPDQRLTVDLSQLGFLDASGMRVLVAADERLRSADRPGLTVRGAAGIVHRIFEIVQVTRLLEQGQAGQLLSFPPD